MMDAIEANYIFNSPGHKREFLADCRWLVEARGSLQEKTVIDASVKGYYLGYEDNVVIVEVSAHGQQAMTVRGKGKKEGGILELDNPVVCLDETGKIYRYHGEVKLLREHVRNLVINGIPDD